MRAASPLAGRRARGEHRLANCMAARCPAAVNGVGAIDHMGHVTDNYDSGFYDRQREGSLRSAMEVLPVVFGLFAPTSLVDFGCGVGTWLAAAKRHGVERCLGLEGPWVKSQALAEAGLEIRDTDLEWPISLGETFDLAMSLEVAEHLKPDRAATFVRDLCAASEIVLFSAAAPGDDGDGHQNEQPASYWAGHFIRHGYVPLDFIRPAIRGNGNVEIWYRTNMVLYVHQARVGQLLQNATLDHLGSLDLPRTTEIIGYKEARHHLLHSARHFLYWTRRRVSERLGRRH